MNNYISVGIILAVTVLIGVAIFMGGGANSIQGGVESVINGTITKLGTIRFN